MQYRQLGKTDLNVSAICLGTMTWGQQNTEAEAHEQMNYAVEQGVNFFDTAELYPIPARRNTHGLTEEYIGTWFKKSKKRHDIILGTKITGPRADLTYIRDHQLNYSGTQIRLALDKSLIRLQTDYVDLYQLHWPLRKTNMFGQLGFEYDPNDKWQDDFLEALTTLNDLIREGKIRHYGLSNETPWGLMHVIRLAEQNHFPKPVSIQNPYNLLNRTFEIGLAECAIREGCGLLAYSPLGFGLLSGKYHTKTDTPNDRLNQFKNLSRYNSTQSWQATEQYLKLAEKYNLTLVDLSLAFVTQQAFTTSNIIGATSMTQLAENIKTAEVILSADILKAIEAVHREVPNPAP